MGYGAGKYHKNQDKNESRKTWKLTQRLHKAWQMQIYIYINVMQNYIVSLVISYAEYRELLVIIVIVTLLAKIEA